MSYATYIFDLDGTLLDTLRDLALSCNYALAKNGMPTRSVDAVRQFVGNGVKKLMERAVPGGSDNPLFEHAYDDFRVYYAKHSIDTTRPYPDITNVLKELCRRGKRLAVVSNKMQAVTAELCSHFFCGSVCVALGEREGMRHKPAPDMVVEALRLLGAIKEKAVYVGDSDVDIATARNAGIPCISVLWGYRTRDFLLSHGADMFISKPEELLV